jgi:hypothetical protein
MSEQDQKAFKMYGKLPVKNHLTKMQKVRSTPSSFLRFPLTASLLLHLRIADDQDRKYFDSAEYAMGKSAQGKEIPTPQT